MYCIGYLDKIFEFDEFTEAFEFGMKRKHRDAEICMFIGKVIVDNGCKIVSKSIGTDYFYFNE